MEPHHPHHTRCIPCLHRAADQLQRFQCTRDNSLASLHWGCQQDNLGSCLVDIKSTYQQCIMLFPLSLLLARRLSHSRRHIFSLVMQTAEDFCPGQKAKLRLTPVLQKVGNYPGMTPAPPAGSDTKGGI